MRAGVLGRVWAGFIRFPRFLSGQQCIARLGPGGGAPGAWNLSLNPAVVPGYEPPHLLALHRPRLPQVPRLLPPRDPHPGAGDRRQLGDLHGGQRRDDPAAALRRAGAAGVGAAHGARGRVRRARALGGDLAALPQAQQGAGGPGDLLGRLGRPDRRPAARAGGRRGREPVGLRHPPRAARARPSPDRRGRRARGREGAGPLPRALAAAASAAIRRRSARPCASTGSPARSWGSCPRASTSRTRRRSSGCRSWSIRPTRPWATSTTPASAGSGPGCRSSRPAGTSRR